MEENPKKWVIDFGTHRKTITSREFDSCSFKTEDEARTAFIGIKNRVLDSGRFIWYAVLLSPDGMKIEIDPGTPCS